MHDVLVLHVQTRAQARGHLVYKAENAVIGTPGNPGVGKRHSRFRIMRPEKLEGNDLPVAAHGDPGDRLCGFEPEIHFVGNGKPVDGNNFVALPHAACPAWKTRGSGLYRESVLGHRSASLFCSGCKKHDCGSNMLIFIPGERYNLFRRTQQFAEQPGFDKRNIRRDRSGQNTLFPSVPPPAKKTSGSVINSLEYEGGFSVKTLRVLAGISALCVACFLVLCTIKNDNGSLAPTGPTNPTGPTTNGAQGLMVVPDSEYIGIGETLSIAITVLSDTIRNTPLANALVYAASSRGWISAESLHTNANGRATLKIMDTTKSTINLVVLSGQIEQTLSIQVTNTPDLTQKRFLIIPSRAVLKADGMDTTTISVIAKDQNNNPIAGQCVQFISSAGMIMGTKGICSGTGQSATNDQGVAQAILTSANANDTAFITAYFVSNKTKNAQTKVAFSGVSIAIHDDSITLKSSGQTTITAVLTNGSNTPIPYAPIQFILGNGTASNLSIVSRDTVTGASGSAQCVIKGKTTGMDSVRVSAAGAVSAIGITSPTSRWRFPSTTRLCHPTQRNQPCCTPCSATAADRRLQAKPFRSSGHINRSTARTRVITFPPPPTPRGSARLTFSLCPTNA